LSAGIWLASILVQYRNSHYVSLYSIRGGKNVWRFGVLGNAQQDRVAQYIAGICDPATKT